MSGALKVIAADLATAMPSVPDAPTPGDSDASWNCTSTVRSEPSGCRLLVAATYAGCSVPPTKMRTLPSCPGNSAPGMSGTPVLTVTAPDCPSNRTTVNVTVL